MLPDLSYMNTRFVGASVAPATSVTHAELVPVGPISGSPFEICGVPSGFVPSFPPSPNVDSLSEPHATIPMASAAALANMTRFMGDLSEEGSAHVTTINHCGG